MLGDVLQKYNRLLPDEIRWLKLPENENGKLWAKWLSAHWFMSFEPALQKLEDQCRYYNENKP